MTGLVRNRGSAAGALRRPDAPAWRAGLVGHRVRAGRGPDRAGAAGRGQDGGDSARCDVFGVPLGEAAKPRLAVLAGRLRAAGVRVDLAYGDRGLKGAMRAAARSGARVALVAGDRDIEAGTVAVKDLTTGEQVSVSMDSVVAEVISRLAG